MRSYKQIGGFRGIFGLAALWLTLPGVAIGQSQPPVEHATSPPASPPRQQSDQNETFTLVGAGDIAGCKSLDGAEATAKLIEKIPGTVFAAGDLAYERGTAAEFRDCYGPTWGRFKNRTRPAPGNHEYGGPRASAYFQYWGDQAGPVGKGYYSYDLGGWHIIALNTNCDAPDLGGCGEGSPQEVWLRDDLRRHPNACIVA